MHRTLLRRAWQSFSFCLVAGVIGSAVLADNDPAPIPAPEPGKAPAAQALPPAPAVPAAPEAAPPSQIDVLPLGEKFSRESAGISIRAPLGWKAVVEPDREEIVRFVDNIEKTNWSLVLTRQSFKSEQHLFAKQVKKGDKEEMEPGIVENTLAALVSKGDPARGILPGEFPGAKILRGGDPTNIGKADVGMIVIRYTKAGQRRLAQYAIIEANDQMYYLLAFNTPGRPDVAEDASAEETTVDPIEAQAVATFRRIIDSVELLDLGKIKQDQDERLIRTRSLFVNLTERKLTSLLIDKRYVRIIREGKDVGYSYIVEEPDRKGGTDGILVGIRTRIHTDLKNGVLKPYPREDSEAWMFTTANRRIEDWSKVVGFDDGKEKSPTNPWRKVSEVGATQFEQRRQLAVNPQEPGKQNLQGENGDPNNPWMTTREAYTLKVQFLGGRADLQPVVRPLPPFYLPQALEAMLPRLIPANEAKTYMIATYMSELREVRLRYIDVGLETGTPAIIANASGKLTAVPISDRVGWEGSPTIHWVTLKGEYLGSTTEATKTVILPTDEKTLKEIWHADDILKLFELPKYSPPADQMNRVTDRAAQQQSRPPASGGQLPGRLK